MLASVPKNAVIERPRSDRSEDTRERILEAASNLFAVRGFEGTTLREITEAAQVNLAAVNYHFRSKDELAASVVEAAVEPIVAVRMKSLTDCLDTAPSDITALSRALVWPLYELSMGEHRNRVLLLMQLRPDPEKSANALVAKHFAPLHRAFVSALKPVLRHLTEAEIALRYDCARGAVLQTLVELAPAKELVGVPAQQRRQLRDRNQVVAALVKYVSAGFMAPAVFKS
jgi:AcrR family transcriptional regulator